MIYAAQFHVKQLLEIFTFHYLEKEYKNLKQKTSV